MKTLNYLMESDEETCRLEMKTDFKRLKEQALWAGLTEGMRVLDVGCGSGITTSYLHRITGKSGHTTGIDFSPDRINHAVLKYALDGIDFVQKDIYTDISSLGKFDFIWVRFFLEYHRSKSFEIVKKLYSLMSPGGILCLVDLDYNALTHYELPKKLETAIHGLLETLQDNNDFDPYAGRKLYSYLYDLNLRKINVTMQPHHLIYGELTKTDEYNWSKKITIAAQNSGYSFPEYTSGWSGFYKEFQTFFANPRRFTYTPLIACRGEAPG